MCSEVRHAILHLPLLPFYYFFILFIDRLLGWHLCLLKSHVIVKNQNQKISSTKGTASVMNELLSALPKPTHKGQLSFEHLQICLLFPLAWFLCTLWLNFWVSNKNNCIMLIPAPVLCSEFQSTEVPQYSSATTNTCPCCVLSETVGWMLTAGHQPAQHICSAVFFMHHGAHKRRPSENPMWNVRKHHQCMWFLQRLYREKQKKQL